MYIKNNIQNLFGTDEFFDVLKNNLPAIFTREEASRCMGRLLSAKTLANMDAANSGPYRKMKVGKKVCYERDSFISWLKTKLHNY